MRRPVDRHPWNRAGMQYPACGLREVVARVAFMPESRVKKYIHSEPRHVLTATVARWRIEQPERWRDLLSACGIVRSTRPGPLWKRAA